MKVKIVKTIVISSFALFSLYTSDILAGAKKFYNSEEFGKCSDVRVGTTISERMKQNAVNHAQAWCKGTSGVSRGGIRSDYSSHTVGTKPYSCRVEGIIECEDEMIQKKEVIQKKDSSPDFYIQKCEFKKLDSLGYFDGNKHNFCLDRGWSGGQIPHADTGTCFRAMYGTTKTDCPRIHNFYNEIGGYKCEHLTIDDATKLGVCGH